MADFRLIISDPSKKSAFKMEVTGAQANKLFGLGIGDSVQGEAAWPQRLHARRNGWFRQRWCRYAARPSRDDSKEIAINWRRRLSSKEGGD